MLSMMTRLRTDPGCVIVWLQRRLGGPGWADNMVNFGKIRTAVEMTPGLCGGGQHAATCMGHRGRPVPVTGAVRVLGCGFGVVAEFPKPSVWVVGDELTPGGKPTGMTRRMVLRMGGNSDGQQCFGGPACSCNRRPALRSRTDGPEGVVPSMVEWCASSRLGLWTHSGRLFVCQAGPHAGHVVAHGGEGQDGDGEEAKKCVHVFDVNDVDAGVQKMWGVHGVEPGQLNCPLDGAGWNEILYVCDGGNKRIQVFDMEGGFVKVWRTFYEDSPCCVSVHERSGNVAVGLCPVREWQRGHQRDGPTVWTKRRQMNRLWVLDSEGIQLHEIKGLWGTIECPGHWGGGVTDVCWCPGGDLVYVVEGEGRVIIRSVDGRKAEVGWGEVKLNSGASNEDGEVEESSKETPTGVCLTANGCLLVARTTSSGGEVVVLGERLLIE